VLVGGGGADAGTPARLGDGEGIRPFLLDKLSHGLQKLILQVPMVVIFLHFYQVLGSLMLVSLTFSFD